MERFEIEDLVLRWLSIISSGNVALFDEILSQDVCDRSGASPGYGTETFKLRARAVRDAFSDIETALDELVIEGSRLAWRWSVNATHTASFAGVAATGKRVTLRGANFQRIESRRIVEHFTLADTFGLLASLRAP
jgi:predicted ester cyclase